MTTIGKVMCELEWRRCIGSFQSSIDKELHLLNTCTLVQYIQVKIDVVTIGIIGLHILEGYIQRISKF